MPPNACAAGNEAAERILSRCKLTAVTRASTLTLSGNRVLKFIPVPTPRWPDLVRLLVTAPALFFFCSSYFLRKYEKIRNVCGQTLHV